MEYIYAALLLHKAGKAIKEENVKAVLNAAGIAVDDARVKAMVAALEASTSRRPFQRPPLHRSQSLHLQRLPLQPPQMPPLHPLPRPRKRRRKRKRVAWQGSAPCSGETPNQLFLHGFSRPANPVPFSRSEGCDSHLTPSPRKAVFLQIPFVVAVPLLQ